MWNNFIPIILVIRWKLKLSLKPQCAKRDTRRNKNYRQKKKKTIDNPIPIKETGLIIKYLLTENLWPQIEFYQTLKKKLVATLHKFFRN